MSLLARLRRQRPQTSYCAGCYRLISERTRRPCRGCGSINRLVVRSVADALTAKDALSR